MTAYYICRKLCPKPTLYVAQAPPAIWCERTKVGSSQNGELYTVAIIKSGFIALNGWFVQTTHCSRVGVYHTPYKSDNPDFNEPLPLSSFQLTTRQYRMGANGYWEATGVSRTGDFSNQGVDGDYLWAIRNNDTPISFDYNSYVGTTLTLPSEFLAGTRLSGPDAHFRIVRLFDPAANFGVTTGMTYGSRFELEYV